MKNRNIKVRMIFGVLFCLIFSACAENKATNSNTASSSNSAANQQKELTALFADFQKYVDVNYPNWKVKGIRKEDSEDSESGEKNLYYLLLNDGKTNKILIIIGASFEASDGTRTIHFFEPNRQMIKSLRDKKLKEVSNREGRDDLLRKSKWILTNDLSRKETLTTVKSKKIKIWAFNTNCRS